MIEIKHTLVMNMENALRGARNPLESWNKSDSYWETGRLDTDDDYYSDYPFNFVIGENDKDLALRLIKAGTDHSKFMRQILVSMDITAPLYWWKEMDTYKVGTVANSTSTMHKLGSRELSLTDFSCDCSEEIHKVLINYINGLIDQWKTDKDKTIWREIIQILPSSFNQTRTWTANYAVLRNIYFARRNHKLSEWLDFCKVISKLQNSEFITIE